MNGQAATPSWSRPWASRTLAGAVGLSLVAHLCLYGGYRLIKHWHWAGYEQVMTLLKPKSTGLSPTLLQWLQPKPKPRPPDAATPQVPRDIVVMVPSSPPMVFVPVDPFAATEDAPDNARYYSDKNSRAANPEIKKPSDQPNIDGQQTRVPRAMDSARTQLAPEPVQNPQPRPPDRQAAEELQPEATAAEPLRPSPPQPPAERPAPAGGQPPGNLALARPNERAAPAPGVTGATPGAGQTLRESPQPAPPVPAGRPRTLVEARSRMQDNAVAGQKMKQEGGVQERREFAALDAKGTPFGAYDAALVAAIQQRWYDLLDRSRYSSDRRGYVHIEFKLHATGRVTDVTVTEQTVGEFLSSLCVMAITDPAPYPKWPVELQRTFSGGLRSVRFTFYYD